jgi:tetratricopeptide (TPR) repeat protein
MDLDFIEQIRALGNIETSEVKMPFGNFFGLFVQQWAETQVRGTVKRQDDNTIAIWVEFIQRGGRSFGVDLIVLPDEATHEVNSNRIGEIANILAVKLVAKLGFHSHLATSWESMSLFLDGLNAAYHRNWWEAIKNYQKAVHIEGTTRNSFGYGYFHLGAVLMSQGEIAKGMTYLEHAESSGPPLAETQYMLALGLFSQNRDSLHTNRTIFTDIEWRCKTALAMRPDFPEAHHLLGTAYYQRGRLRERFWTKKLDGSNGVSADSKIDPIPSFFEDDYDKARFHLQKSIKVYDQAIRRLPNDLQAQATVFNEQSRLIQDRMAATHRLADALRCLRMYAEADSYYHELLTAFPRNNRTLVDLAKTYTLARNWGKADEFLRNEVFNHQELCWNKSASFYMGWSQLGGLSENENFVKRLLDMSIHVYESVSNWNQVKKQTERKKIFWNAVCWLDFAIHQYPGYLYVWKQMNWLDTFQKVVKTFVKGAAGENTIDVIYQGLLKNDEHNISFLRYWLAWRILGNTYIGDENLIQLANSVVGHALIDGHKTVYPNEQFGHFYAVMQEIRSKYALRLEKDDVERNIKSIQRRHECLELGSQAYGEWKVSAGIFRSLMQQTNASIKFGDRWAADVFADFSLLTIKLLIEGKAFEYAKYVATDACELLADIKRRCDDVYSDFEISPIGEKVISYQLSMLYAWQAYSTLMMMDDVATLARLELSDQKFGSDDVQAMIDHSGQYVSHNPLTAFSQALLYKRLGSYRHAADELNQLSTLVAPFDPHKYVTRDFGKSDDLLLIQDQTLSADATSRLYKKERIHGRRQIDVVVNLANIHYTLASVHAPLEEFDLVAEHLNVSISTSSYQDFTAELFLNLAIVLNQQEKFEEALTAAEEAIDRHMYLSRFQTTSAKCLEPFVLECVLTANVERYSSAFAKARRVRESVDENSAIEKHREVLHELKKRFSSSKYVIACITLYEEKLNEIAAGSKRISFQDLTDLCLRYDKLAVVLRKGRKIFDMPQELPSQIIFASQVIALLARDLFEYQVYSCDILNNIAFTSVELNFNLDHAKDCSEKAVDRMGLLLKNVINVLDGKSGLDEKSVLTKSISRQLNSVIDPVVLTTSYYEERLANYLDTQAWIYFKLGTPVGLSTAYEMLSVDAMKYGSHIAVIYYHLARVCVSKLESLWQAVPATDRISKDVPIKKALEVTKLLRLSSLYWRQAMRLNRSGSLHTRLSRVHERLTVYRMEWELIYRIDTNYSNSG